MDAIAASEIAPDVHVGPFHTLQRDRGATFYEDEGAVWTASFGDPVAEYWAVRRGVGLLDTSGLVKFRVTGPDTLVALDRLTTRRLVDAEPGLVRYGMLLDEHGLMLDDVTVIVVSNHEAYLLGNYGDEDALAHLVTSTAGLDVGFANVTVDLPSIAVQGPGSFEVLDRLVDTDVASLRWFRCLPDPVAIAGVHGMVVRAGFTGELGYEFYLLHGADGADRVWEAVEAAGAVPIGLDAIEMLRIEAGLVIAEEDYFPGSTDPLELGLGRFIDLGDHDFIGSSALAERLGSTTRSFVTLRLPDAAAPDAGTPVTRGGQVVGEVRSVATTPRFGTLALSVVDVDEAAPGTRLLVDGHEGVVHATPIDDPDKLRPRSDPRSPTIAT